MTPRKLIKSLVYADYILTSLFERWVDLKVLIVLFNYWKEQMQQIKANDVW